MPGSFVLSLDFELHWGIRDHTSVEAARARLLQTREAVTPILELFAEYDVHATWATVGFLLAQTRDELEDALPRLHPTYDDPALDPYRALSELGASEADDPFHFAASLVRQISTVAGQEIGTHTLSHYYTLEPGQDLHHFAADLQAARALHERYGLPFESLVFPRNQYTSAHVEVAAGVGIVAVRGPSRGPMYAPASTHDEGWLRRGARLVDAYLPLTGTTVRSPAPSSQARVVDVPSSMFLRPWTPRLAALEPLRLRRITDALTAAARRGGDFHLWFHPHNFGADTAQNLDVLRAVLDRFAELRSSHGMSSLTMAERAHAALREAA